MKVFITGATGLIGSEIAKQLITKGYDIVAIRRASSSLTLLSDAASMIEWHTADLFDTEVLYELIGGVDYVIHCAGVISEGNVDQMYNVNVDGTANIVNACIASDIKKLVHFSSISALGKSKNGSLVSETTKWEDGPQNSKYGESKMLGEREVWRGIAEDLSAVILNPSVVLGVGDGQSGSSVILPLIAQGPKRYLEGGTGFVDVIDVAALAIAAMESDIVAKRYVVSGYNKSFRELMTDVATSLGVDAPVIPMKKSFLNIMSNLDAIASFVLRRERKFTKTMVMQATRTMVYDNALSKFDFNFSYTPWEETIERLCKDYKSNNNVK